MLVNDSAQTVPLVGQRVRTAGALLPVSSFSSHSMVSSFKWELYQLHKFIASVQTVLHNLWLFDGVTDAKIECMPITMVEHSSGLQFSDLRCNANLCSSHSATSIIALSAKLCQRNLEPQKAILHGIHNALCINGRKVVQPQELYWHHDILPDLSHN